MSFEPNKSDNKDVENLVCFIERFKSHVPNWEKTAKILSDELNTIQRLQKQDTVF